MHETQANKPQGSSPASPCVSNCCLDKADICMGCFRHIDEITGWHQADKQQRRQILDRCETRKKERQDWLDSR